MKVVVGPGLVEGSRETATAVAPFRHWSLITRRGGTKWENCGSETFCAPPLQDRVKLVVPPPF